MQVICTAATSCASAWQDRASPPRLNTQVSKFLFGDGFAISGGDGWRVRRKAVGPALHRAYLETMLDRVFGPSAVHMCDKLQVGGSHLAERVHKLLRMHIGQDAEVVRAC